MSKKSRKFVFVVAIIAICAVFVALSFSGNILSGRFLQGYSQSDLDLLLQTGSCPKGDFEAVATLQGESFPNADLAGANFDNAMLIKTTFTDADFTGASMLNVFFMDAILVRTKFNKATLSGAKFNNANLENAYFNGADLVSADFTGANLAGADLRNADLDVAILADVKTLKGAKYNEHTVFPPSFFNPRKDHGMVYLK